MSNHHPSKSIKLHHKQVAEGKDRKQRRQDERWESYLIRRAEAYEEYWMVIGISAFIICYAIVALAVGFGRIISGE